MSYLHFELLPFDGRITKKYSVHNNRNGELIGHIRFYPLWRKFAFYPEPSTFYDAGCLKEISAFISDLQMEWIENKKK